MKQVAAVAAAIAALLAPAAAVVPMPSAASTVSWGCALPHIATAADDYEADVHLHMHNGTQHAAGEQKVLGVTDTTLNALLSQKSEDVFITFFAPWCPACRTFVMFGEDGDPASAPLEKFNEEMVAAKGPKVVKFDITKSRAPSPFIVETIPTVYLALKDGQRLKYTGDRHDTEALKSWALRGGAPVHF